MNRRNFLATVGAAGLAPGLHGQARDIYRELIKAAERDVEIMLPKQQADGGLLDDHEIPLAHNSAGFIRSLAAVYLAPESRYHRSGDLLKRMMRAADNLLKMQRADGTVDLPTTNFGSPPDTGFVIEPVGVTAAVLRARRHSETGPLEAALEKFMRRAGEALTTGGIHTPNHRWVVVAALARCHRLFPDPRYLARVDQWLGEGMDLDEDAQFTERSTGVYNWVTDNVLITAGRLLDRPALYEPARKNLEAMFYFLHPGGEVATDISRRQDRFQRSTMLPYWRAYRYLSVHDGNGRFAAMADAIEREHGDRLAGELIYFLEMPELRGDQTPREMLPENYEKFYPRYEFAHIRRGERSATVLGRHSRFFTFRHGGAVVEAVRLAGAFFGKGQFSGALRKQPDGYRMEQELQGDYVQPLDAADRRADGDWLAMPHARRRRTNRFRLHSAVAAREIENGFELSIEVGGTEPVPLAIEITLRPGGNLTGDGLMPAGGAAHAFFLKEGHAVYELAGRRLRIGPGFRRHGWTQLRGAEPRIDGLTLYLTDFTPFKRTIQISAA